MTTFNRRISLPMGDDVDSLRQLQMASITQELQRLNNAMRLVQEKMGTRSIQTAFVASGSSSIGAGEDAKFRDYTLGTAVTDYTKCTVYFTADGSNTNPTSARLTSNTNLRASATAGATFSGFRYYVVEYA